jgi:ParB-like chromosome segregation protein Spo0J
MSELPHVLSIADLFPHECCAVKYRYERAIKCLNEGKQFDPVEITVVDGCYLVTNGCNRVKAAKDFGLAEVPAKARVLPPDRASSKAYRESLQLRNRAGHKGFEKYEIVESDEIRDKMTLDETGIMPNSP